MANRIKVFQFKNVTYYVDTLKREAYVILPNGTIEWIWYGDVEELFDIYQTNDKYKYIDDLDDV